MRVRSSRSARATQPADWRALRAASAGTVCALGAVVAHLVGGGAAPSAPVLVSLLALSVLGAGWLAARRLSGSTVVALALLAQAVLHLLNLLDSPTAGAGSDTRMLVSHLVAAGATALVGTVGEEALAVAADLPGLRQVRLRLPRVVVLPPLPRAAGPYLGLPVPSMPRVRWLGVSRSLRGPPAVDGSIVPTPA